MQGCPYDALYLNESSGTAEKCHFCAHRVEVGLAPACAVVCPTEAIIPGDFHDPDSVVSRMRAEHDLRGRKLEAGTGPYVLYRDVGPAGIEPQETNASGGYLWANRGSGAALDVEAFQAMQDDAETKARTTYDVDHPAPWGASITAYLFFKSLAAGLFLILALLMLPVFDAGSSFGTLARLCGSALMFLVVTTVLLVADLERPERFLFILLKPNWTSWLTRGSFILAGYGAVLTLCLLLLLVKTDSGVIFGSLVASGAILAALSASYTGWLFAQAKGRALWMRRGLWLHLLAQACVAGAGFALLAQPVFDLPPAAVEVVRWGMVAALLLHVAFVLTEGKMAPQRRHAEYHQTVRLITRGPFAARHYGLGMAMGVLVPLGLLIAAGPGLAWMLAGLTALVGLYVEEDIVVRAGQALSIS
jgi:formate-dependent nitrite reductase membrane component NrfD